MFGSWNRHEEAKLPRPLWQLIWDFVQGSALALLFAAILGATGAADLAGQLLALPGLLMLPVVFCGVLPIALGFVATGIALKARDDENAAGPPPPGGGGTALLVPVEASGSTTARLFSIGI
jgi:hypothetical protein